MAKYKVLDLFYKSIAWLEFRTAYIAERLSIDGGHFCDYCGKWIDEKDQITLHHEEELTPDNYMIAEIALNPDNIKQVHRSCHNKIHKHAGQRARRVYLIYGPPMSGKSTLAKMRAWTGDLIIDIDEIYMAISGLEKYNKPNGLLYNALAIQNLMLDHVKTRYGRWDNAFIIGGYPDRYKRNKVAKEVGAEIIFMDVSKEECMKRLERDIGRADRREEWTKYIDKWFDKYTA